MNIPKGIAQKLNEREENNSLRSLHVYDGVDFFSNDYLGLSKLKFTSTKNEGATGSRLISGNSDYVTSVEEKFGLFFGGCAGLFYNSGYDANLGFFSSVPKKGDTILYDSLCHASIRDGIRLSLASSFSFRHNDLIHLKSRLQQAEGDVFVAVEAIYSMDGDFGELTAIAKMCKEYGAYLFVDEAHSAGVFGEEGKGLVDKLGLNDLVFAKLITFGKAYGSHGALIVSGSDLRAYLINFSRSFIYTTALPPASIERIDQVVNHARGMNAERNELQQNVRIFEQVMMENFKEFNPSGSPIQSLLIPGNSAAKSKAEELNEAGYAVKAILYPTVPKKAERLRVCLHSFNTENQIKAFIKLLK
jgi:8-amino-7-oxononanoate synthase